MIGVTMKLRWWPTTTRGYKMVGYAIIGVIVVGIIAAIAGLFYLVPYVRSAERNDIEIVPLTIAAVVFIAELAAVIGICIGPVWWWWVTPLVQSRDVAVPIKPDPMVYKYWLRIGPWMPTFLMTTFTAIPGSVIMITPASTNPGLLAAYVMFAVFVVATTICAFISFYVCRSLSRRLAATYKAKGICYACGYDIRTNPDSPCPECGYIYKAAAA